MHLHPQLITNPQLGPLVPDMVPGMMDREEHFVFLMLDELGDIGLRLAGDDVDFVGELLAVEVEREIVDVVAEGVFDFAPDQHQTDYYVRGEDCAGDRHPAEVGIELEGEKDNVYPADLVDLKRRSALSSHRMR